MEISAILTTSSMSNLSDFSTVFTGKLCLARIIWRISRRVCDCNHRVDLHTTCTAVFELDCSQA